MSASRAWAQIERGLATCGWTCVRQFSYRESFHFFAEIAQRVACVNASFFANNQQAFFGQPKKIVASSSKDHVVTASAAFNQVAHMGFAEGVGEQGLWSMV